MNTIRQVHNLIILDESGSMESINELTISGFNELVQTIKEIQQKFPDQEHFISLVLFNSLAIKRLLWMQPVSKLESIDAKSYCPDAGTPLFDAMGESITHLEECLAHVSKYNVLVTVFTDGEENASQRYSVTNIKSITERLQEKNWTFTYIGTDHDIDKAAFAISITNVLNFKKTKEGIANMFAEEVAAREIYSANINENKSTRADFYTKK